MIREKNYSLIKAIRESSCCSKSEGRGGEPTFDDVVKYYTGLSPDEIDDWKTLQTSDVDSQIESSFPYVKISAQESADFFTYIENGDNYWNLRERGNLGISGVLTPSPFDSDSVYAIAEVYNTIAQVSDDDSK